MFRAFVAGVGDRYWFADAPTAAIPAGATIVYVCTRSECGCVDYVEPVALDSLDDVTSR